MGHLAVQVLFALNGMNLIVCTEHSIVAETSTLGENFGFRSCMETFTNLSFQVSHFSIPMVNKLVEQRCNVSWAMGNGRHLKIAHFWVLRRRGGYVQPRCSVGKKPFTTESLLDFELNVFVLEKRAASLWVFSQAATDVDSRELSSRAQRAEDNRSPNTAASFSMGPNSAR